jgi:hypothetical protein
MTKTKSKTKFNTKTQIKTKTKTKSKTETKTKTPHNDPECFIFMRRQFFFSENAFVGGCLVSAFPPYQPPQRAQVKARQVCGKCRRCQPGHQFYPQRGAFSPQDRTVPSSCPRVVAEESDGNHGLSKDKVAAKVTKEVSRKGGNERDMAKEGKERRKSSV